MRESKINKYDILLFLLLLCTAGGMWGGAFKPARVFSVIFAIPMLLAYGKVKIQMVKEVSLFLIFLAVWSLVSLLWTPNPTLGISEWGNMIFRILFFLELVFFGVLSKNTVNSMINGWTAAFLITAVIAVWELNTGNHLSVTNYEDGAENMNLGGGQIFVRQFAQATFYNYNGYVTYVCYCIPFMLCSFYIWAKGIKQVLASIPIIIVLYVFILNASRGGIIAFIIYAVIFSYFKLSKSNLLVKVSFFVLLLGIIIIIAQFWELMSFYLEYRMETGGMSSSRTQIWECCWQALLKTNFMGCGIGGVMEALIKEHAYIPQPHNFFIEVLLEFGVVIFIWLIFLMWKVFRNGRNSKNIIIKYVRISSFITIPFVTMIDSGYVQQIGIWAFLGSLLLINLTCKNKFS